MSVVFHSGTDWNEFDHYLLAIYSDSDFKILEYQQPAGVFGKYSELFYSSEEQICPLL